MEKMPFVYQLKGADTQASVISAHKNIQHEARYAELLQDRFKDFRRYGI